MSLRGGLGLGLIGVACATLPAADAQEYGYRIELQLPSGAPVLRVELPADAFRGLTRADLGDLRVVNGAGEAVPFGLASGAEQPAAPERWQDLPIFPILRQTDSSSDSVQVQVRQRADGTLVSVASRTGTGRRGANPQTESVVIDAARLDSSVNAMRFGWATREPFSGSILLEASDDLRGWRPIAERAPLVELAYGGHELRRDRVEFASTRAKYYRVRPAGVRAEINRVEVRLAVDAPEIVRRVASAPGRPVPKQQFEYEFDLGGLFAIDRLSLVLPQINTLAPVEFSGRSEPSEAWRALTRGIVYRLAPPAAEGDELRSAPLTLSATSVRYLRVRADARSGGLGSGELRIQAGYLPRFAVFVARGQAPFAIEYGRRARAGERDAQAPKSLALANLLPGYKSGDEWKLPEAKAGPPQTVNIGAVERTLATDIDPKKAILWSVLIAAVLLLGLMAWRLSKGRP
jgi:hypothetical protein